MSASGALTTLTLPTGVTLSSTVRPKFAIFGRYVFVTNSPTRNLWIDPSDDTVRPMGIQGPASPCMLAAGSGTGLTGVYKVRVSFIVKDTNGKVIYESPFGPTSAASASLANQDLAVTGVPLSADAEINGRRLYRTLAGGNVYFQWIDLDDNTATAVTDSLSDASLNLLPAPTGLGLAPGSSGGEQLKLLTSWHGRLWGVSTKASEIDNLRYSEDRLFYAWPATNTLPMPPIGQDSEGITAFAPRRDDLGVFKRDSLEMVTGFAGSDFQRQTVKQGIGCIAPESVVIIDDTAYFLAENGVYRWSAQEVTSITEAHVHAWMTTTTYFQRASFDLSVGWFDQDLNTYNLLVPATGASALTRWISYDLGEGGWLGPHLTSAFTPNYAATLEDSNDLAMPVICGTDGFVYKNQSTRTDGASTGIALDVDTIYHSANTPDIEKLWLELSLISKIQGAGTLTITPKVGGLDASAGTAISADMTKGRERLRRLGQGRFMQLNFAHSTNAQDVELYGLEIPYHELGRR